MSSSLPPDLRVLVDLFYSSSDELGQFQQRDAAQLPTRYRTLLSHDEHMTVAVEARHGAPVDVRVLAVHRTATHYSRKILLTRPSDQRGEVTWQNRTNRSR